MNYFTLDKILAYNIPINIIITQRGIGKSFTCKDYVVSQYKKKKAQFLYLRRYENELKSIFEKTSLSLKNNEKDFFDDIKILDKYKNDNLYTKNKKFYLGDNCMGFAKRLTEAQDLKSSTYEKVKSIIFDEYPIEKSRRHYLPNEGMIFLNILDSIIRNRSDVKVFILGNAVENIEFSPIFQFFNLTLPYGKKDTKIFKNNSILVHYAKNLEIDNPRKNTLIGKLAENTEYEKYAIKNQILNKNNNFIEKKKNTSNYSFAFIFHNIIYGVWYDFNIGKIFISKDYNKTCPYIYSLSTDEHTPNTLLISSISKSRHWKSLLDNYKLGNVYFENQNIKKNCIDVFRMFLK